MVCLDLTKPQVNLLGPYEAPSTVCSGLSKVQANLLGPYEAPSDFAWTLLSPK